MRNDAQRKHRWSRKRPAFPAQWFDGLWRALPGDEFVLASVAPRIDDTSIPVGSMHLRESLTVATTARTTRFCRTRRRRSSCAMPIAHDHLALRLPLAPTPPASTASRPAFVMTYDRPFGGSGRAAYTQIPNSNKAKYF